MTSSTNTTSASTGSNKPILELELQASVDGDEQSPKVDEAVESLSEQLEAVKDARREERFLWIILCVILIDVIWFRSAPNPTFPVVILVLEAVVLFILAKRMGVDEAQALFARLLESITRQNG